MPAAINQSQYLAKAREVHGDRYDYSRVAYDGAGQRIEIICKEHGAFKQIATQHLQGKGCKECGYAVMQAKMKALKANTKTTDDFIAQATEVHKDTYDYSETKYVNAVTKVAIKCKAHGVFKQRPGHHITGSGCPRCRRSRKSTSSSFKSAASKIHKGKYLYNDDYISTHVKVKITCTEHGDFKQTPAAHLRGAKCPICAGVYRYTSEQYFKKANEIHQGKYTYKGEYTTAKDKVTVICKHHGAFMQEANSHLRGSGCPKCPTAISQQEKELFNFIKSLDDSAVQQYGIGKFSYDIRVGKNLIEYHGLYWHSTATMSRKEARQKHINKRLLAEEHGFRYVAIYADEWKLKRELIENYLKNLLGKAPKTGARLFKLEEVQSKEARAFYEKHHILGGKRVSGRHMALTENGIIAACMSVGISKEQRGNTETYSLSRYCTDGRAIAGAATRLLKSFGELPEVVSYIDLDKFDGSIYELLGFEHSHDIEPDYMTVWGDERKHKTSTQHRLLAKLKGYSPDLSEYENCKNLNIYQIYNSGRRCVVRPASISLTK